MPKPSHREKILVEGLKIVHQQGYAGASVRDIVRAAGVPQGSFTNHFESKEAFGLAILELYISRSRELSAQTLRNEALRPLQRVEAYVDGTAARMVANGVRCGCLYGNFAAEASAHSEKIRERVLAVFADVRGEIASCLKAAVEAGDLAKDTDCDSLAGVIVSSLQGAVLLSKLERSMEPMERFKRLLRGSLLNSGSGTIAAA